MRRTARLLTVASLTLGLAAGCAATPRPTGTVKADLTLITREQIQEMRFTNAYDAVKGLRGDWIRERGPESFRYPTEVQVYLDGVRMVGGVQTLQTIPSSGIQFIRHYNGLEATSRWGIDHGGGVVFVSTKVTRQGAAGQPPG